MVPTKGTVDLRNAITDERVRSVRYEKPTVYFQMVEVRTTGTQRSQENNWTSAPSTNEVQVVPKTKMTESMSSTAVCVL